MLAGDRSPKTMKSMKAMKGPKAEKVMKVQPMKAMKTLTNIRNMFAQQRAAMDDIATSKKVKAIAVEEDPPPLGQDSQPLSVLAPEPTKPKDTKKHADENKRKLQDLMRHNENSDTEKGQLARELRAKYKQMVGQEEERTKFAQRFLEIKGTKGFAWIRTFTEKKGGQTETNCSINQNCYTRISNLCDLKKYTRFMEPSNMAKYKATLKTMTKYKIHFEK